VCEFAARGARLEHEFQTQSAADTKLVEAAIRRETAQLTEALTAADTRHQADREGCLSRFERRKDRIAQAIG